MIMQKTIKQQTPQNNKMTSSGIGLESIQFNVFILSTAKSDQNRLFFLLCPTASDHFVCFVMLQLNNTNQPSAKMRATLCTLLPMCLRPSGPW